jgi:hypothetical protein
MTASLGIRVIRSSLADWRSMKKECRHARHRYVPARNGARASAVGGEGEHSRKEPSEQLVEHFYIKNNHLFLLRDEKNRQTQTK